MWEELVNVLFLFCSNFVGKGVGVGRNVLYAHNSLEVLNL